MVLNKEDPSAFALHFMDQFTKGYQLENNFELDWLDQLPLFMKMREIELYGIIHRSFDLATMDDEWNLRYMAGRKEKIEKDVPFIETDFRVLKNVLSD